ncbi:cryptic protein-like isoform X2 [Mytilus trossulus]|uniref:cryptic protein-like isoform X2 n=1 Tax=Mytilus trossulus TaxID=6551 RepID=UPI0030054B93
MAIAIKTLFMVYSICSFVCGFSDMKTIQAGSKEKNTILKPECCKNKGTCILGSFCVCKKNHFGRHCEHKIEFKPCGHILHGSWIKADCNLCKCFDGKMSCIPRIYDGCEYENELLDNTATTKDPLTTKDIQILSNDRDYQDIRNVGDYNIEDYYYEDDHNSSIVVHFSYLLTWISVFVATFIFK